MRGKFLHVKRTIRAILEPLESEGETSQSVSQGENSSQSYQSIVVMGLLYGNIDSNRDNKAVSNMMHLQRLHTLSTLEWVQRNYF